VGYGATYYAYLFAQSLAAALWEGGLAGDPTGRAAGELLRRRLMEVGARLAGVSQGTRKINE
jgi:intermediate peptidase